MELTEIRPVSGPRFGARRHVCVIVCRECEKARVLYRSASREVYLSQPQHIAYTHWAIWSGATGSDFIIFLSVNFWEHKPFVIWYLPHAYWKNIRTISYFKYGKFLCELLSFRVYVVLFSEIKFLLIAVITRCRCFWAILLFWI